jgi:hypothetical protein
MGGLLPIGKPSGALTMRERPFLNIAAYTYLLVMLGLLFAPLASRAEPFTSSQSSNSVTFSATAFDGAASTAALALTAGAIYATQPATFRTISGVVAPLVVRAAPVAGAVGSAVLACFGNPACLVATAAAAAYVANELSFNFTSDPVTGLPVVTKSDPAVCTAAPCYQYRIQNSGTYSPWFTTRSATCDWLVGALRSSNPSYPFVVYPYASNSNPSGLCNWTAVAGYPNTRNWEYQSVAPAASSQVPSTTAELSTAIGAKTDWASDSNIVDLLTKIVKNTSQSIPLQIPSVTGPTSIVDTPTVETKADGSKVTTTKTTNFGYYGPTATATETTVKADTTPGGVTTTSSTTTGPASLPAPVINLTVETCGVPGKPACIISEVGTPTAPTVTGQAAITDGFTTLENTVTGIQSPTGKDTGWGLVPTWLQSGTSCHPVVLITFPPTLGSKVISLDICPHLDNIYLLMNALWVIWTFNAVVGLVRGSTATGAA